MGAITLRIVRGSILCYLCRDEVANLNLACERGDEEAEKYVLVCNECASATTGVMFPANVTPITIEGVIK